MPSIFMKLINAFKPKKKVHIEIDPESVRKHHLVQALANENATLKGKNAKLLSELGELRESKKDIKEEDEVRIELNEQKKQLEKKHYPKYLSLMSLCKRIIYNKKLKENLYFYNFDGSEKLAKFGDFGLSGDGKFVLLDDKKRVITYGKNLNDVFWSVGGLEVDIKANKIPLCLDKDGGFVENPMVWEASELIPTKDGKFRYSKARKKPFYEYIKELMSEISKKQEHIEELELTLINMQRDLDDLRIGERIAEDSAETSRSELGQTEKSFGAIHKIFRGTERELSQLRDTNVILEDNLQKLENQVETLRGEAEKEGTKLSFDKALETIQNIKRELVRDEPSVKIVEVPTKQENLMQNPKK